MLDRTVYGHFMLLAPVTIVTHSSTIDDMFRLFSNIRLVGLQIELISSPPEFVCRVILHIDTAKIVRTIISTHPKCIHI